LIAQDRLLIGNHFVVHGHHPFSGIDNSSAGATVPEADGGRVSLGSAAKSQRGRQSPRPGKSSFRRAVEPETLSAAPPLTQVALNIILSFWDGTFLEKHCRAPAAAETRRPRASCNGSGSSTR